MIVAKQRQFSYQTGYGRQQDDEPKERVKLKKSRLIKLSCFLSLFICLGMAIGLVSHYNQVIETNKQVIQHERHLNALYEEKEHLTLQIAQLSALKRIETFAMNEIGMYYPRESRGNSLVATTN